MRILRFLAPNASANSQPTWGCRRMSFVWRPKARSPLTNTSPARLGSPMSAVGWQRPQPRSTKRRRRCRCQPSTEGAKNTRPYSKAGFVRPFLYRKPRLARSAARPGLRSSARTMRRNGQAVLHCRSARHAFSPIAEVSLISYPAMHARREGADIFSTRPIHYASQSSHDATALTFLQDHQEKH